MVLQRRISAVVVSPRSVRFRLTLTDCRDCEMYMAIMEGEAAEREGKARVPR